MPKKNNIFIQNITNNWSCLEKLDSKINNYFDPKYLLNNQDSDQVQAEHLLTSSLRLQHYLGY